MSRVHCIDCGMPVVVDPNGLCPDGHFVGTAGARIESAIGTGTPHPDEPEPWVSSVEDVVDVTPQGGDTAPGVATHTLRTPRPPTAPGQLNATSAPLPPDATGRAAPPSNGRAAAPTSNGFGAEADDLLRELHSLSDDLADLGSPAVASPLPPPSKPLFKTPPPAAPRATSTPEPAPVRPTSQPQDGAPPTASAPPTYSAPLAESAPPTDSAPPADSAPPTASAPASASAWPSESYPTSDSAPASDSPPASDSALAGASETAPMDGLAELRALEAAVQALTGSGIDDIPADPTPPAGLSAVDLPTSPDDDAGVVTRLPHPSARTGDAPDREQLAEVEELFARRPRPLLEEPTPNDAPSRPPLTEAPPIPAFERTPWSAAPVDEAAQPSRPPAAPATPLSSATPDPDTAPRARRSDSPPAPSESALDLGNFTAKGRRVGNEGGKRRRRGR